MDKNKILSKVVLYATGKTKEARLRLSGYKNFFRWQVWIYDIDYSKGDKRDKPKLAANLPINRQTMEIIVDRLFAINDIKEETHTAIESYSSVWVNDKPTDEKKLNGRIYIGRKKDSDGNLINYIRVISGPDNKSFVFKLEPSPFVRILINGKEANPQEASELSTIGYARTLDKILGIFPELMDDEEASDVREDTTIPVRDTKDKTDEIVENVVTEGGDDLEFEI